MAACKIAFIKFYTWKKHIKKGAILIEICYYGNVSFSFYFIKHIMTITIENLQNKYISNTYVRLSNTSH